MIRVLVVDDQAIVREGIRSMLALEPDITVSGEAANGYEALQQVATQPPDLVLMDVRMPEMDGLTALERIKALAPRTSVLMLTLYDDPDYLLRAVVAGAAGYVLKDTAREDLVRAIRITAEGGAIVAPSLLPELLKRIGRMGRERLGRLADGEACQPARTLSEREIQVLALIAEGLTNQEIGERLVLSPTTVKTHVQNILQKLDVSDRTQAAVYAVRCGLV